MKKTLACLLAILMLSLVFPVSAQSGLQDVPANAWYAQAVSYVTGNGLMHGVGDGKFSPGATVTRGMFVTVLSRLADIDRSLYENSTFDDVSPGAYDSIGIQWAAAHGIVNGKNDRIFAPKEGIRREDAAVILFRYAQKSGNNIDYSDDALQAFTDQNNISPYALQACKWAAYQGILNGSGGRLNPRGYMTRAQLAQLLYNSGELLTEKNFTAHYYLAALPKSEGKLTVNLINHLILFYNDYDLRTEIYHNISIEPFLNTDDIHVAETARFAQTLLSGGSLSPYISELSDNSRVFVLFNDYYDYGSGDTLYRIEGAQMEPFFTLPKPATYIREQILSSDKNHMLIKACSRKSDTLILLDMQNKDKTQELVNTLKQAIADDGLYPNNIREDYETYATVEHAQWMDENHLAFTASIPYNDMASILKVSAEYDLTAESITYKILETTVN